MRFPHLFAIRPEQPSRVSPLQGHRVLLRDFVEADLDAFFRYRADPRYSEFYEPGTAGFDESRRLVERFVLWSREHPRHNFQLAIVERTTARLIGCCGLRTRGLPLGYAEFGIELAPERWGRGLASEASRLLLELGFGRLALEEIRCVSVTQNARLAALARALGFSPLRARTGEAWMRARHWTLTDWALTKRAWSSRVFECDYAVEWWT
ncbi:MAG TPA: GNAT family N-acetyltransferase [Gammaproteobacteria bacterium]|nr:GNAT family N-acetyltransferase [Gammaproteobacteria bacterium]